jgi:hypothetical protein
LLQRSLFHRQIGFDVRVRSARIGVAQPERDRAQGRRLTAGGASRWCAVGCAGSTRPRCRCCSTVSTCAMCAVRSFGNRKRQRLARRGSRQTTTLPRLRSGALLSGGETTCSSVAKKLVTTSRCSTPSFASCEKHGINAIDYLTEVLMRVQTHAQQDRRFAAASLEAARPHASAAIGSPKSSGRLQDGRA